jgi:23S rRNA (guanosine2251-2'-O)-methyltransferase
LAGKIIHGLRAVQEALASGAVLNRIYFAKESRARGYKKLLEAAKQSSVPIDFVPQAKLNDLANTREHQGIAAALSPVEYASFEDCLAACGPTATLLLLDQVQHARNVGLMIRSAVGAGAAGVLLSTRSSALLDDTVVRASAGAVFRIPIAPCPKLIDTIARLRDADFWIFGLDGEGDRNLFEVDWPERVALIVGNESSGIRPGLRKKCDELVRIPMANSLDSLNAAVAAGIGLFQIASKRG